MTTWTWKDNIKEAMERRGTTVQDIERMELFLDRQEWRDFFTDSQWAYLDRGTRYS